MITTQDLWLDTTQGRLFAKRWQPAVMRSEVPIVLFHDSLGCVALWRDFPEQLALTTGRTVIAYDRLGFGQSDPSPHALDLDFIHTEAHGAFSALCQQLNLSQYVVFGHSVGGAMAAVCAASFPEHCRALITESAQAFVEDSILEGIRLAEQAFTQEGQLDRLKKYHGDKAEWVLNTWVSTWLAEEFRHWNLDEVLPSVHCPVLSIHGENDEYGSNQHPERFSALSSGTATMQILPDCGHIPHREQQSFVLDLVQAFLA